MRFLSETESRSWAASTGFPTGDNGLPRWPATEMRIAKYRIPPSHTKLAWFCAHLERCLQPRTSCLLWVTTWGVWPTSENWHLYYRLRQAYGDPRLLHEAPGHLFLDYEGPDFVSFLQVAILSGWDAHVLPAAAHARAFLSHDEFIEFASSDPATIDRFERSLNS